MKWKFPVKELDHENQNQNQNHPIIYFYLRDL